MTITELLKEHNLRAENSFNSLAVNVYEGDEIAFAIAGSDLAQDMTPEGTEVLVRRCIEDYETRKKING